MTIYYKNKILEKSLLKHLFFYRSILVLPKLMLFLDNN